MVDIDGDGDITDALYSGGGPLTPNTPPSSLIVWYENDGNGSFSDPHLITHTEDWEHARSVYAVDVDSDGDMDVLSAIESKTVWFENDGSENFTHPYDHDRYGFETKSVYAVDVDGDGGYGCAFRF